LPNDEKVYAPVMSSFTALFFNLRGELFSSVDVRRAVSLGFDHQGIVDTILRDQAVVATGPIPNPSWAYSEQPVPFDPVQATEILLDAGWSDNDDDGILEKGTSRFSFPLLVNADDPQRVAVASEIAQQLARIKIQVQIQPLSTMEVSQALASRQFAAAVFGWHSPTGDPDGYQLWHSSQAEDGLNFVGLRDQSIDKLLEEARSTSDLERRKSLYADFQVQFARAVPAVVLYYPRYYFALDAEFQGVGADPIINPSDRLRGISSWYTLSARSEPTGTPRP
jgi:peptide/nickel transport system substrate-binding protein